METTLGQKRVKVDFNPAKDGKVHQLKNLAALMIDSAYQSTKANGETLNYMSRDFEGLAKNFEDRTSPESVRLFEIVKEYQQKALWLVNNDAAEVDKIVQHLETACMYAVKLCFTK